MSISVRCLWLVSCLSIWPPRITQLLFDCHSVWIPKTPITRFPACNCQLSATFTILFLASKTPCAILRITLLIQSTEALSTIPKINSIYCQVNDSRCCQEQITRKYLQKKIYVTFLLVKSDFFTLANTCVLK